MEREILRDLPSNCPSCEASLAVSALACPSCGTEVRGSYDVVSPPELIAMRWDFDDDNVPVPGRELVGYLRVEPTPSSGSVVEVHQLVETPEQAVFMQAAWSSVLGRFRARGVAATSSPSAIRRRRKRDNDRNSA